MNFLRKRLLSFRYAINGLVYVVKTQHNAWLHLSAAIIVVIAGLIARIETSDWLWLASAIALVWFAETINTAFEFLCDVVSPEFSTAVTRAKDIAAGAVLICAIYAVFVGAMVFLT